MIQLNQEMLRMLQLIELEMLVEVDRICKKCNIKYSIIAGTLLGAVRHEGFIPWDDDADVGLLRSEYEKFRKACETEMDSTRFYFQDHRNTKGYRWGYGKIRRKNTLFLRENQEHMPYEQGVFIDIFPLDGIPNGKISCMIHSMGCFFVRKILWSAVGSVSEKNVLKKFIYKILYKIPDKTIMNIYEKLVCKSNGKDFKHVRALTFPLPNRNGLAEREWFEKTKKYKFENYLFEGCIEEQKYLRYKFGDYMELPPEDKRKCHPVSSIKFL